VKKKQEKKRKNSGAVGVAGLSRLPSLDSDGNVRVVVETPRGSRAKIAYDPEIGAFTFSRALPAGIAFPFDFGFVPATRAGDGDPLDALVLHDDAAFPGVVIPCQAVGVIELEQSEAGGKRIRNDRLVMVPIEDEWARTQNGERALTARRKTELEGFFLAASRFEGKRVKILGWRGPKRALRILRRARV
jgi:inorganic pyrophosphatase